ncbi:MAG: hypothetical protein M0Z80_10695 [Treponema sp.]|nr:hypothetical protein [Treponema sp.]
MSKTIADRIAALIESTGRIEKESEQAYLALGRLFPLLSSEMARSADIAERSLTGIGSALSIGSPASGGGRGDSGAFFRALHDRDTAFLERINDSMKRLGSLDEIIARIRADSEEMEIISLNAMTAALKSGNEGRAFSVITDELKRLSGSTIALADSVTGIGRSLLQSFDRLRSSLAELDAFRSDYFASLDETVTKGFGEIERKVVSATDFFAALLAEARRVGEPVAKVMQDIQLQDILRQSLQHVAISLREAEDAAVSDGDSAFVAAVIELSRNLLDEVGERLGTGAAAFGGDMESVRSIVDSCESRRAEYLARAAGASCVDTNRLSEGSSRYLSLRRGVIVVARRLSDQVRLLDESFKGISALLSRFQTIVVASRIEVAKTKALQNVATTVRGMIELTDRIESDVGGALGMTKSFIKVAIAAIADYSAEDEGSGESLVAALDGIESYADGFARACDSVEAQIGAFSLYTPDFIRRLEEVGTELARIGELTSLLASVRADLAGLLRELNYEPGSAIAGEHGERLRRMVERFTIFTHKKAAGDIGDFAVETGSDAGEITLF